MRHLPVVLAIVLVGPGCAYIGQAAFEEKRDGLDHDKDGAPFGGPGKDCDDFNDKMAPKNEEIPYDGFDNDCQGGDVVDADNDGFPGILKEDYLAANPDAEWPSNVLDGPLDCADNPDIWPNAKDIFPGQNNDPSYDGIDSDCEGDNDFDDDGDGYMPDEYQTAFEQYVLDWGYDHLNAEAQFGDCYDFDDSQSGPVNPGVAAVDDVWYDGWDSDCAGNNDFDADGDTYMYDQDANETAYLEFVQVFHPNGVSWPEQWGDCLDQADPSHTVTADPALVFPSNPSDDPYDGIDSDCLCDNDFDADADGVMPDTAASGYFGSTFDDYDADWGCGLTPVYGDCDDSDPDTSPGALEKLDDLADSDCDGDPDLTPFGFGDTLWEAPRPPRLAKTNQHYVLISAGDYSDPAGLAPDTAKEKIGVALPFDPTAGYNAQPAGTPIVWIGAATPLPIGLQVDGEGFADSVLVAANTQFPGSSGYITAKSLEYSATTGGYVAVSTEWDLVDEPYEATGVDVTIDSSGHPWVASCGPNLVQVIRGDVNSANGVLSAAEAPTIINPAGIPSGMCFWNDDPIPTYTPPNFGGTAEVVVCEPGVDCEMYDFDADSETLTLSATNPWAGRQIEYGQFRDGWHILLETGLPGVQLEGPAGNHTLLSGWTVYSADAHWRDTNGTPGPDEVFVVGVAEPIPDDGLGKRVVLSRGPIGGPYVEKVQTFTHPTRPDLEVDGVGVYADADRLFIGVSAVATTIDPADCYPAGTYPSHDYCLSDTVGWVFYGW